MHLNLNFDQNIHTYFFPKNRSQLLRHIGPYMVLSRNKNNTIIYIKKIKRIYSMVNK